MTANPKSSSSQRKASIFIHHFFSLAALSFCLAVMMAWSPPSGRPPIGPLERYEAKLYDFTFDVSLIGAHSVDGSRQERYSLSGTPIVLPIVYLGTYSRVNSDTVSAKLHLDNRESNPRMEIKSGYPHGTHLAVLTVDQFSGHSLRWLVRFTTQVWSSRINDEQAAQIPWPEEWPKEVQDGLAPQMYIESDDDVFSQAVEHVSQGRLRFVPPYLAAKDLIRYCVNQIQVNGDGLDRGEFNALSGMLLIGAREAAMSKLGSPHDLVCVCVAILRAAGIPARPVIGAMEDKKGQAVFVSWGEFYLPEAGWIPFDPNIMRGKGVRTMEVRKPWPEFGTMKDLNLRIPLAYHFIPPMTVETPRSPAVWGWDPRPTKGLTGLHQVRMTITSRGKGVEDPK